MRVFVAQIVVDVGADDVLAHGFKTGGDAFVLGAVGQMSVADIKIEAQPSQPRFFHKGAQVGRVSHLAGGIFHADRDAHVLGMKHQVLQGAECGITFSRVGSFPWTSHVENHPGKGKIFSDIDCPLELVHGLDAPHTFDFGDGKRSAAFAVGAKVAAGGGMQRGKLQAVVRQNVRHATDILRVGVVKVAAARKKLDRLKARAMHQRQKLRRELFGYKEVGRKDSLHALQFIAEEEVAQ